MRVQCAALQFQGGRQEDASQITADISRTGRRCTCGQWPCVHRALLTLARELGLAA
jgi:hypothetical protein